MTDDLCVPSGAVFSSARSDFFGVLILGKILIVFLK